MYSSLRAALTLALAFGGAVSAGAQVLPAALPSEPVALAGGRVTISGDVSGGFAPEDTGFFNYTDYEHSALRLFRVDLSSQFTLNRHVAMLAEIRDENLEAPRAYAFYLRIRPWTDHAFDVQVGRVPPTFGAFPRRSYASDNLGPHRGPVDERRLATSDLDERDYRSRIPCRQHLRRD